MSEALPRIWRVTELTSIYTCAYKWKNEPYVPDLSKTRHWDLMNAYINWKWKKLLGRLIDQYIEDINKDIKMWHTLKIWWDKIQQYRDMVWELYDEVLHEAALAMKYDSEHTITWVPDLHYYNHVIDLLCIEDLKTSTHSWYTWEEMFTLNLQTYLYPLMAMVAYEKIYPWLNECWFRYVVVDKNSGKIKTEPPSQKDDEGKSIQSKSNYIIRTRKECEDKLKEVMEDYIVPYLLFWDTPARKNKLCTFCSFRDTTCPLKATFSFTPTEDL